MMRRALIVWIGLMLLAVLNGVVREALLLPRFGSDSAHLISTLMLGALIVAVAYITLPWLAPASSADAVKIGVAWFVLTLTFEFVAGHYVFGRPWQALLADYDVRSGRVWPLIPLLTLFAPALAFIRTKKGITS
jgi:uncharacterized membrane protein YGL010W